MSLNFPPNHDPTLIYSRNYQYSWCGFSSGAFVACAFESGGGVVGVAFVGEIIKKRF